MTLEDMITVGFRNAFIVIGFACVFIGLITRRTGEGNKGLGMALIVTGVSLIVAATVGRFYGWW